MKQIIDTSRNPALTDTAIKPLKQNHFQQLDTYPPRQVYPDPGRRVKRLDTYPPRPIHRNPPQQAPDLERVSEHWILCGDVNHPGAPMNALRLCATGPKRNLGINISAINLALREDISPIFEDAILIGVYSTVADRIISDRNAGNDREHHHIFKFVIRVNFPDFWTSTGIRKELEETLGSLTGNSYLFEFKPLLSKEQKPIPIAVRVGSRSLLRDQVDEVQLLSGGLDSFGGAIDSIVNRQRKVVLVSHCPSKTIWKTQNSLAVDLYNHSKTRGPGFIYAGISPFDNNTRHQRIGAFLNVALAGAFAGLLGQNKILIHKNGVSSLNLQLSPQAMKTQTIPSTHPRILKRFSRLLSAMAGKSITIENPFEFKTRAEIVKQIAQNGAAHLIAHTVSCNQSPLDSDNQHCGTCSQCMDRRFAVCANRLKKQDAEYDVRLHSRKWEERENRKRLIAYVAAANRCAAATSLREFQNNVANINQNTGHINQRVFEMYRRHGKTVGQVVSSLSEYISKRVEEGKLTTNTSLIMLSAEGLRRSTNPPRSEHKVARYRIDPKSYSENVFLPMGDYWIMRFNGGVILTIKADRGFYYIRYALKRPDHSFTAFELIEMYEGRQISKRPSALALNADEKAINSVIKRLKEVKEKRDMASEAGDKAAVARYKIEEKQLAHYLCQERGLGGKFRPIQLFKEKARCSVSRAIRRAIERIREESQPMANHLATYIRTGFHIGYIDNGISNWQL